MSLLDWLTKRKKPLSRMTRSELRRQELLLEKDRSQLLKRVTKLAREKQEIFQNGATEQTPEVRRVLAQEFELKTSEQLMLSRQLNIRSKEMLTVSRLRMLRENAERAGETGGRIGLIGEKDIVRLGKLIENDSIKAEVYQERLDEVLSVAAGVEEGTDGLSEAGRSVMDVWQKLDDGAIANATDAFDEADRRVRERHTAAAEE
ncbi:MAG TPA: hypothetical protein VM243_04635 [Phycisphaerae bacterium]|nr:hypothetical protein [Phycisphaerae bacterium]